MLSLGRISTHTLAALLLVTLPFSALAEESKTKATSKPPVKGQSKQSAKETKEKKEAKPATEDAKPAKDQAPEAAKEDAKEGSDSAKEEAKSVAKPSPDEVLVRINGTPITRQEVDRAVKVMLAQSQIPEPVDPEIQKEAETAALEQLSAAELLYQEAAKVEVKDLDKQVAAKIAENRAKFKTEAEFEQALNSVNMTSKDMEEFTRKDLVISNYIQTKIVPKADVTEAEARKFYTDNLDKYFKKPESARASHILIGVPQGASEEERKKAKEKAEGILKRIKAGEDFAAIAKSESSCPSSAQGGDLGKFTRGQMVPEFDAAAFALKPGQVSDVVETQFGYHIVKLTEKEEAKTESFEDVKPKIMEFLKQEKVQKAISDQVDALKKTAKIEKP
jgi:peptidyl-prolyl cis-trans isomerase C